VPTVNVAVSFDAGYAADPHSALGTQSLMLSLMDEGTTSLDSIAFAEAKERLGAQIDASANADETVFSLFALKPNLGASLGLLADYIRNPAFDAKELERVRAQQLNRLKAELNNPERDCLARSDAGALRRRPSLWHSAVGSGRYEVRGSGHTRTACGVSCGHGFALTMRASLSSVIRHWPK
jgi:hypothetical protein